MKIEVKNCVVTVLYGRRFDLDKITKMAPEGSRYDPWSVSAVFWKLPTGRRANIFETGKVVFVGLKSIDEIEDNIRLFEQAMFDRGIIVHRIKQTISQIVVQVDVERKLFLERLHKLDEPIVYEPETFPAATIRLKLDENQVTLNVFNTGKIIIYGLRDLSLLEEVRSYIENRILPIAG